MSRAKVVRSRDLPLVNTSWGSLQWLVSGRTAPGAAMTLGRVTFKPGQSNPVHAHPNCEEILFVVEGAIEHTLPQGGCVRLDPGDCIVLPRGGVHAAKNIGTVEAVVLVAFNTPDRLTDVVEA